MTLALSAFLAGMGGGFYAFYFRYVDPDAVAGIGLSMEMVFIAVVGGLGTVGGPLIGAVFLTTVGELVRERFQMGHLIFYGLFMMLVIRFMPEGIWGRVAPAHPRPTGGSLTWRCSTSRVCRATSAASAPSPTSPSRWTRARSWGSSGRTAPARRRSST